MTAAPVYYPRPLSNGPVRPRRSRGAGCVFERRILYGKRNTYG